MTESPLTNSFGTYRSLFTAGDPFLIDSGHISRTDSITRLQCRSNALTLPKSFLLFLQLTSTCVLSLTHSVSSDRGPTSNLSGETTSSSMGIFSESYKLPYFNSCTQSFIDEVSLSDPGDGGVGVVSGQRHPAQMKTEHHAVSDPTFATPLTVILIYLCLLFVLSPRCIQRPDRPEL